VIVDETAQIVNVTDKNAGKNGMIVVLVEKEPIQRRS
jgi:hypothetical protein